MIEVICTHDRSEGSLRCRACHGQYQRQLHAAEHAETDRQLLEMRDEQHLSDARIAARIGSSRQRVHIKIRDARRRERVRQGMSQSPLA